MTSLTPRQLEVLAFIRESFINQQRMPSIREIGNALGIVSPNGIICHLRALENKGYIRMGHFSARSIQLCGVKVVLQPIDEGALRAAS